ncbi:MAG: hypothetical protein KIS74_06460 [Burkholderiales bacterium]|nr:hypothetical protein [Burkholderiales bacterium]
MKSLFKLACLASLSLLSSAVLAQSFPSRPVTMVVPFAAGGPVDTVARILAEPMRKSLGQAIVVESTTGAGGSLGVGRVARAAPDGYTLSIGHWSTHVVNGAVYQLNYDLLNDLEPVAMIGGNPMIVVSKPGVEAKNLKEFVDWVKANQAKVNVGTAGAGSSTHIAGIYFANEIGAKLQFIPYKGTGPMQDLMGGQIDMIVDQLSNSIPQVRAGHQGLRHHREGALGRRARRAHRGRGGPAGAAHQHLVRIRRPRARRGKSSRSSTTP